MSRTVVLWITLVTVGALLVCATGCGATATPEVIKTIETQVVEQTKVVEKVVTATPEPLDKHGGTMVWGVSEDPPGFNPILNDSYVDLIIAQLCTEPLTWGGENYPTDLKPVLAEKWEMSSDGLTWTIHLRKGVKWSDGEPFTADDVVFWADAIQDEKSGAEYFSYRFYSGDTPHKFEKVDDLTVKVTTADPITSLMNDICLPLIPKHYFVQNNVSHEAMMTDKSNTQGMIGTGPFKVVDYVRGESVTLERNEYYWAGKPYLDRIVMRILPDPQAMAIALQTGEVDWAQVWSDMVAQVVGSPNVNIKVVDADSVVAINISVGKPMLRDKRTRQAMMYALNRQAIVNGAALGYGGVMDSIYTWAVTAHRPLDPDYAFDPEKAKALLEEVGWKPGADGILVAESVDGVPQGTRFEIEYLFFYSDDKVPALAQAFWKEVGIDTKLRMIDSSSFYAANRGKAEKPYDVCAVYWGYYGTDGSGYEFRFGSADPVSTGNGYANQEVAALFGKAAALHKGADRDKLYDQLAQIIWEDAPLIPLYYDKFVIGMGDKLHIEETEINTLLLSFIVNPDKVWKEK